MTADIKKYEKVACAICGFKAHFLLPHLAEIHNMSEKEYAAAHPGAPVMNAAAAEKFAEYNENPVVEVDIKKTFGIKLNDKIVKVPAYAKPHMLTPPVDPNYRFTKNNLLTMCYAFMNDWEPTLFVGPTGSGKSSLVMQFAARLNWPVIRINMDGDLTRADFVGQWKLKDGEMVWHDGLLPTAMRIGAILIIDEWDAGSPSNTLVMQAVLEEGGKLTITETGEVISPAPGFCIFATGNTGGMGDETGLYNGTQVQNYATIDRFKTVEIVDYPVKAFEAEVITAKTGIDDVDILNKLLEVANLTRKAFLKGDTNCTFSTRTILNVAEKLIAFGDVKTAYRKSFLNKLNSDDKVFVDELIQRVWGAA